MAILRKHGMIPKMYSRTGSHLEFAMNDDAGTYFNNLGEAQVIDARGE